MAGRRIVGLWICLVSTLVGGRAAGITVYVPTDIETIQMAIDQAQDGDEIVVLPGDYYSLLSMKGKNVTLRSTDPTSETVVRSTILCAPEVGVAWIIRMEGTEGPGCLIEGFHFICSGYYEGGGIDCSGAAPTIRNNLIFGPFVHPEYGGEIGYYSGFGAGIQECAGRIEGNRIVAGFAETWYSPGPTYPGPSPLPADVCGLFCCTGIIANNAIALNRRAPDDELSTASGMICCSGTLINNTIYGNTSAGMASCEGILQNNILWGNGIPLDDCSEPTYSCIEDWSTTGTTNISANPRLADPTLPTLDFHLLPDSPCIDAGGFVAGLTTDFEGDPRPVPIFDEFRGDGSGFDIGMDEFIPNPSVLEPILRKILNVAPISAGGDQNQDGTVDIADWIARLRSLQ